ncbi:MAG TPA: hypothetical protein PK453_14120 [Leptospiraceae bacterium]|nr:hypothetical protein [Leptospiraceae bacterium]HNF25598.1 hypothetical protein [Leptospiraceae bacterium]HNM05154.1 hypothetical protein [Leptospiraceae bacterium]HNN04498.1 hypothetical protein [Leptospiraceae bacterium]
MIRLIMIFSLFSIGMLAGCTTKEKKIVGEDVIASDAKPQTFQKIAPLTSNALGARKNLHEKGWYFIPSSSESYQKVKKSGRMSFQTAKAMLFVSMKKRAQDYPGELGNTMAEIWKVAGNDGRETYEKISKDIYDGTYEIVKWEVRSAKDLLKESGKSFLGYASLGTVMKDDMKKTYSDMAEYNGHLGQNYASLSEMFEDTRKQSGDRIANAWKGAFSRGAKEWKDNLAESGEQPNSALALWNVFKGYTLALKEVALSPVADTAVGAGQFLAGGTAASTGTAATGIGQIIVTTGLTLVHAGKAGYRVLSPSMESGFLGTLGVASAVATVPTAIGAEATYGFNQTLAFAGAHTVKTVGAAGGGVYETGATAAGLVYDFGKGTGESVFYGLESGIVLSYTALTAIPAHMILTVPDGTIFLAWDGPRLVIARVRGNYKGYEHLPTGSIVDLNEARKAGQVEIVTDDQKVVKKVLEKEIEERELELKREEEKGDKK